MQTIEKMTTEARIECYLVGEFNKRRLTEISRDELQTFLDRKSGKVLIHRLSSEWDLVSIFRPAVSAAIRRSRCSRRTRKRNPNASAKLKEVEMRANEDNRGIVPNDSEVNAVDALK
jgi:hypothetical protein